jgi:hypothetical protein
MATIFQKKFMESGDSIREWIKHSNVPLHLSTVALVLGDAGEIPSVENHLLIGYCLGFTPAELQQQMVERHKKEANARNKRVAFIFSKLITPTPLQAEEIDMIDRYRGMSAGKQETVRNLITQMAA